MMKTAMAILIAMMMTTASVAKTLPDYSDEAFTCDKDRIEREMTSLVENSTAGKFGLRVIYVKDDVYEISRSKDELRCRVTIAMNTAKNWRGMFKFYNQDGHALVGFQLDGNW